MSSIRNGTEVGGDDGAGIRRCQSSPAARGLDRRPEVSGVTAESLWRSLDQWHAEGQGRECFHLDLNPIWPEPRSIATSDEAPGIKVESRVVPAGLPLRLRSPLGARAFAGADLAPHETGSGRGCAKRTLNYWRARGRGPDFVVDGNRFADTGKAIRVYLADEDNTLGRECAPLSYRRIGVGTGRACGVALVHPLRGRVSMSQDARNRRPIEPRGAPSDRTCARAGCGARANYAPLTMNNSSSKNDKRCPLSAQFSLRRKTPFNSGSGAWST